MSWLASDRSRVYGMLIVDFVQEFERIAKSAFREFSFTQCDQRQQGNRFLRVPVVGCIHARMLADAERQEKRQMRRRFSRTAASADACGGPSTVPLSTVPSNARRMRHVSARTYPWQPVRFS